MLIKTEWIQWTAASVMLSIITGCGGGNPGDSPTTASESKVNPSTSTSTATAGAPATQVKVFENGVDSDASECVAIFLDSLRRGDERAANGVLTTKAREELAKTPFVIEPLGTPDGEYKIGRVGFPYEEKDVALVECTWIEPPVPGEERSAMEIVCEVHLEAEGWRISGMGFSFPGTDEAVVLDFEDAASLQATLEAATAPSPSDSPQQPTGGQEIAQQQMQQESAGLLPTYPPEQQINVENSAPPQIAYPPQYDPQLRR